MFPIALDLKKVPILLVGEGDAFHRRCKQLQQYGAEKLTICECGEGWQEHIKTNLVIMVAGLSRTDSEEIANAARTPGRLVNVEDVNDLCDFYFTANLKQGDLLISVSTGGASPTLACRIRDYIAKKFGKEWAGYTKEMGEFRDRLRDDGKKIPEVMAASEAFLEQKGWLND